MSFLLDTDICSAFLKGNRQVANRFLLHTGGLYINTIVLGELLTWALKASAPTSRVAALHELLRDLTIIEINVEIAEKFGEVRARLFDRGVPMPSMDLFIAATALVHDLTLVTHNSQDYANVPDLRTADWLLP